VITVGAYEAKTRFSELIERVQRGEAVTITKHGTPVARLVGITPAKWSVEEIVADVERLREGLDLGGDDPRDYIHEGHRI
jgi:prevent-host-death family protein